MHWIIIMTPNLQRAAWSRCFRGLLSFITVCIGFTCLQAFVTIPTFPFFDSLACSSFAIGKKWAGNSFRVHVHIIIDLDKMIWLTEVTVVFPVGCSVLEYPLHLPLGSQYDDRPSVFVSFCHPVLTVTIVILSITFFWNVMSDCKLKMLAPSICYCKSTWIMCMGLI